MENQRSIQSANFDLVNAYFGNDVGHTYDGIDVTSLISDTLSVQQDRFIHVYDSDLFLQLDIKRLTVQTRYLGSKKPLGGFYHYINIGSFYLMLFGKYGIKLFVRCVFFYQSVWCRG